MNEGNVRIRILELAPNDAYEANYNNSNGGTAREDIQAMHLLAPIEFLSADRKAIWLNIDKTDKVIAIIPPSSKTICLVCGFLAEFTLPDNTTIIGRLVKVKELGSGDAYTKQFKAGYFKDKVFILDQDNIPYRLWDGTPDCFAPGIKYEGVGYDLERAEEYTAKKESEREQREQQVQFEKWKKDMLKLAIANNNTDMIDKDPETHYSTW